MAKRSSDRTAVLASVLSVVLSIGMGPAAAQDLASLENSKPQVVEGDIVVGPKQEIHGGHTSGSVAAWSPINSPFSADPFIAWRDVTAVTGSHAWEVWRCDGPGSSGNLSVPSVISNLTSQANPYFQLLSRGRYNPGFTGGGPFSVGNPAPGIADCLFDQNTPYEWGEPALSGHGFLAVSEGYGLTGVGTPGSTSIRSSGGTWEWDLLAGTRQAAVGGVSAGYSANQFRQWVAPLVLHEIGHGLGWPHVPIRGVADPYANPLDIMSGGFGAPFVGTAMINLYGSGWIDPSEVTTWTGGASEVRLGTLPTDRPKIVIIRTGDARVFYTVSVQPTTYDSVSPWGVVVHRVDQSDSGGSGYCFGGTCTLISREVEVLPPDGWASSQPPLLTPGRAIEEGNWRVSIVSAHSDGFTVSVASTGFIDTAGHIFESEIDRLADAGITRGCNPPANTRFCPNDVVTRGQMAAFLVRALGLASGSKVFSDTAGHLFEAEISRLEAAGITRGCNPPANTRFCPNDAVTRGQMAAFMVRAGLTE